MFLKNTLIVSLLLLLQFNIKADTISHWGIYINDVLLFEDNLHQEFKDSVISFNLDSLKEEATLKIVFRGGTIDLTKRQNLAFTNEKGDILLNVFKNKFMEGDWSYISINKSEIKLLMNKGVISICYSEHQTEENETFTFTGYWKLCCIKLKGKALPFDNDF